MAEDLRTFEVLERLNAARVDYIVVGGVAAILHGSPVVTRDIDVVYSLDPENLRRAEAVLESLEAIYRDPAGRVIQPTAERLAYYKTNLLDTRFGKLDLLQTIRDDLDFDALAERSIEVEVAGGRVTVVDLDTLIEAKAFANRPKDHYGLLFLRAIQGRLAEQADS